MLGRVYSPARAAITYSHPYYTPRTVVCRRALGCEWGGVIILDQKRQFRDHLTNVFELKLHFVQNLGGHAAYTARQTSPPSDVGRGGVILAENSQPCNSMSPESDSRC